MVLLDPMRFPFIAAALFSLIALGGCGVKTDPVPYLDTLGKRPPAAPSEPAKSETGKNQAPK